MDVKWNTNYNNNLYIQKKAEDNTIRSSVRTTALICAFVGTSIIYSNGVPTLPMGNSLQSSYIKNINLDELWAGNIMMSDSSIDLLKIDNINKIKKLKQFKEDWNGHGAPVFSDRSISLFLQIVNTLSKQPNIAPTGKAGLLLQYEALDKSILAFNVSENKVEQVYVPQGDYQQAEVQFFVENLVENIKKSVEWFNGLKQDI